MTGLFNMIKFPMKTQRRGRNILIVMLLFSFFLVGHGGDGFLKFQDSEEITSIELADAFEQMWQKRR